MDPNDTITEISNAGAGIDLDAARKAVANTKATLQQQELAVLRAELRVADEAHADLVPQCRAAQDAFDILDRKVEAQKHILYQANTAKAGAPMATSVYRGNGLPKYATPEEREQWRAGLAACFQAEKDASAAAAAALAELSRLQGERRMAVTKLQELSWREHDLRVVADGLRKKLEKMQPRSAPPPAWMEAPPEKMVLQLDRDGARQIR